MDRHAAFTALRRALQPVATSGPRRAVRLATGLSALDQALEGGIPRAGITCVEGRLGTGRSWLVAALLRQATSEGFAALLELPESAEGYFAPPALAQAGVQLARMLCVHPPTPLALMRAAEWLVRSGSLRLLAVPGMRLREALWRRLAHIAEAHEVAVVVHGMADASLRHAACLQLSSQLQAITWAGQSGPLGNLSAVHFTVHILKNRHGAYGGQVAVKALPFAHAWSQTNLVRQHRFAVQAQGHDADFMRYSRAR